MKTSTWLVGRNLTFRIGVCEIDADGTITDPGDLTSMVGRLDRAALRMRLVNEEISALDAVQENHVWLRTSNSLELTEILDNFSTADGTTGGNVLAYMTNKMVGDAVTAASNNRLIKVTILRGGKTFTYYGIIEGYEEGYERGKNVGTMTLNVVATLNNGSAVMNPDYA